jgi:hypothetical protein
VKSKPKKHNLQKKRRRKRLNQNQRKSTTFKSTSDALSSILNGPKSNERQKAKEEKGMTI